MSRRLSKASRATKPRLSNTLAPTMPKLDSDGLEARLGPVFARKRSLRASLMVGTALSAGFLGTLLVNTDPAMAAGTCPNTGPSGPYTNVYNCNGSPPFTNIGSGQGLNYFATNSTLIEAGKSSATTIGANAFEGDGIGLFASNPGLTLGVTTYSDTTIGVGPGYAVTGRGIHVYSDYNDTTIIIDSAAQIGEATQPIGDQGIRGRIVNFYDSVNESGTVNITNSGAITAKGDGIFAEVELGARASYNSVTHTLYGGTADAVITITNSGTINSLGNDTTAIYGRAKAIADALFDFNAVGGTATASVSITNSGTVTGAPGIGGRSYAYADAFFCFNCTGGTATAGVTITNSGSVTDNASYGISGYAVASADAGGDRNRIIFPGEYGTGGTATATVSITNSGAITARNDGIEGRAKAYANAYGSVSATGGTASSSVTITNSGAIGTSTSPVGTGIYAFSLAEAFAASDPDNLGTDVGGTATATTYVANSGAIYAKPGIVAASFAYADATFGFVVTGGTATATTTITNSAPVTDTGGFAIDGYSLASADGGGIRDFSIFGYTATGGTATATTSITNSGALTGKFGGIYGGARAYANAFGDYFGPLSTAVGGLAIAGVTISNSGPITSSNGFGIDGFAFAEAFGGGNPYGVGYTATGGTALAGTTIYNAGSISSHSDGIDGGAVAEAGGYGAGNYGFAQHGSGTGGLAIAGVSITNHGAITSTHGDGIDGFSEAFAIGTGFTAQGGTAIAGTSIYNTGSISSYSTGIDGFALAEAGGYAHNVDFGDLKGSSGTGGTAIAGVYINNSGTVISKDGTGIDGASDAFAIGTGFTAQGGTAIAGTTIINTGSITSYFTGIDGFALAEAGGYGSYAKGGSGTGGTALASVYINNSGAVTSKFGPSIEGSSEAYALGGGYTAKGGTAIASTTIINSGPLTSFYNDGIRGKAYANASAYSSFSGKHSTATGGYANAAVLIVNSGSIATGDAGSGIVGESYARATAHGYTALGGVAIATTQIYNSAPIHAYGSGSGIEGYATANASAYSSFAYLGSVAVGGFAQAVTYISNSATIIAGDDGIEGHSYAFATAHGFSAFGGFAYANTEIVNSGKIVSDDGIEALAVANASAYGSSAAEPGTAVGGIALAVALVNNTGNITATENYYVSGESYDARGIAAISVALADAYGHIAVGGVAQAYTAITNSGTIRSTYAGIYGEALAYAFAVEAGATPFGSATGGYANAQTVIANTGNITSTDGPGIFGYSLARAGGYTDGVGGTAIATTTITNAGRIASYGTGIYGGAVAYADGEFTYGGVGGVALASVFITNTGKISTYGNFAPGIAAVSFADADAYVAGYAKATTEVFNYATITTIGAFSPGIAAVSGADASGTYGGIALASTTVLNNGNITTSGYGSPGIAAFSEAFADGFYGGYANAYTGVVNNGFIRTSGDFSPGIFAASYAFAIGDPGVAYATTVVVNNGTIVTAGVLSPGIYALSLAAAGADPGLAIATTYVANNGSILTAGPGSAGIQAAALAYSGGVADAYATVINAKGATIKTTAGYSPGIFATTLAAGITGLGSYANVAQAVTSVTNAGTIKTYGSCLSFPCSPGIEASSYAVGGSTYVGNADADTIVVNTGTIVTHGTFSAGVIALSLAQGNANYAAATSYVTNTGTIATENFGSPGVDARSYATGGGAAARTVVTNSGTIRTYGAFSDGVDAYASALALGGAGNAAVIVNNSGVIHTYGYFSNAITAGINFGDSYIHVNNASTGIIVASGFPYHAVYAWGAPVTINNAGYIRGNVVLNSLAHENNKLTNTFNNTGKWVMQGDSWFGGNASTALNNIGTSTVATDTTCTVAAGGCVTMVRKGSTDESSHDTATSGYVFHVVTLHGLANVNNEGGLIDMIDGQPNDRIVIENGDRQVNFVGTGNSRLGVDAFLGGVGSTADVLQIGGKVGQGYVTGLTNIIVNDTNPGPGAFDPNGIPVAESGGAVIAGTPTVNGVTGTNVAGNFDLPQGPILKGLFQYDLLYVPGSTSGYDPCQKGFNCWFLASTPSTTALELPRLITAAQDIFEDVAGLWFDRNADLRDYYFAAQPPAPPPYPTKAPYYKAPPLAPVGGVGPGIWFRAFGDWAHNDGTANFTAFGQTFAHNVNYSQDTGGAQIGADFAAWQTANSTLLLGALGGAVDSKVNFNSGTNVHFQGGNLGAYATYLNRSWFADALFLANFMTADFSSGPTLLTVDGLTDIGTHMSVQQLGGHLDTGYRFQFNPWFVEPEATIEVINTDFCGSTTLDCFGNNNIVLAGTELNLNNTSVRSRLGGRIGTTWINEGWRIEPSVTGGWWQTLTGNNVAELTSNGFVLDLTDANSHRSEGEIGGMLNAFRLGTGWSAFVKGEYKFAKDYSSGSVKGGVRYQFWPN
jgi:hypothetical protein